jgi:hypothetical protein
MSILNFQKLEQSLQKLQSTDSEKAMLEEKYDSVLIQRDNALERLNYLDAEQKTFETTLNKLAKERAEESRTYEETIEELTKQLADEKSKYSEAMLSLSNQLEGFQRPKAPANSSPKDSTSKSKKKSKGDAKSKSHKRANDSESVCPPPKMKEKAAFEKKDPFRANFDAARPKTSCRSIERFLENTCDVCYYFFI